MQTKSMLFVNLLVVELQSAGIPRATKIRIPNYGPLLMTYDIVHR